MSVEMDTFLQVDIGSTLSVKTNSSGNDVILSGRLKYEQQPPTAISHAQLFNTTHTITLAGTGDDARLRLFARFSGIPTRVDIEIAGTFQGAAVSVTGKLTGDNGDTQMAVIELYID